MTPIEMLAYHEAALVHQAARAAPMPLPGPFVLPQAPPDLPEIESADDLRAIFGGDL